MKSIFLAISCASLLMLSGSVHAQSNGTIIATLNGNKITTQQVDELLKLAVDDGTQVTPEIRQRITNELIIREAIVQEAKKTGLATKNDNALKLKLAGQNAIVDLWFADYFKNHPISEADIRAEYDKQLEASKDPKNANEYEIAQIAVATEIEATEMIVKLNNGNSFEALARQYSVDKGTAQQGGLAGWSLSGNLTSPLNDIVPNLSKGKATSKPIRLGANYYIIKLVDVRPFKFPAYEQAKNQLAQQMANQEREQAIAQVLKASNLKVIQ
ncbi:MULTISPECIES: peptidylprolyl isomerase [unclassified Polynucleobacter]|nr:MULTISPECIES: peptidylprolyl isomerase [unclassified Polynucleobacter]MBU3641365.1 peptidylprolyl isomerase [Polynucleobacter sp. Fuers-14]OIN03077.1 hypothetical protein A9235_00310 [Polynucleobacter sp. MWH-Tro8-2-5-gr]